MDRRSIAGTEDGAAAADLDIFGLVRWCAVPVIVL